MAFVCVLIYSTTLLAPRIPKTSPITLDIRMKHWTLICLTIWTLLTWIMFGSERSCCVPRCGRTRKDDTVLHSFPNPNQDRDRFLAWTQAVGTNISTLDPYYVYKNRRVCHIHFETKYLTWTRRLCPGAVPTLFLPGFNMARVPMTDITNRNENPLLEAAIPSTSRDSELETIPKMSITNKNENHSLKPVIPSTSEGEPSVQVADQQPRQKKEEPKLPKKMPISDHKALINTITKLQVKKDSYAKRLKKALKLSENRTFQTTLKKFTTLAAMFTLMQFREIGKNKMGRRFTEPEKIMALSLYKRSPRTYRWLQKVFVLPSAMTLSRLIARANLKPGLNKNIFELLKQRVEKMKADDKLCILLYDEMAIAPHFDYNQRKDLISGFVNNGKTRQNKLADHALVFMIRGIQKNYKQPIAYTFCSGSTSKNELAALVKDVIRKLHDVGLRVLATVCDQGASNVSAINFLIEETKQKYLRRNEELRRDIFEVDDKEVIPLYDPPHLIKGIRNNLMTKNLKCSLNGSTKVAKWEHIVKLHEEDPAYKGIRLIKKLTDRHIKPDNFQKMKVKYATQVLSQKVAATMGFLAEKEILPAECSQTADIILFYDELFDSLNGSFENSKKRSGKNLLNAVTPKSDHSTVWSKAKVVLSTTKFVSSNAKTLDKQVTVPTINNWLRTINNAEYLIEKLFNEYNIKSVWMRHFNQDPLENFFGSIRSHGCRNTNPTAAGFESSFAALLINNLSGQHSPGSNCEDDSCQTIFKNMECLFKSRPETDPVLTEAIDFDIQNNFIEFEVKKYNPSIFATLQYVTGYLLRKARRNVFKNCKKCQKCFYAENNSSEYVQVREYKKGKKYLTYANNDLVNFFSKVQDLVTYVIKNQSIIVNIKTFLKTLLYVEQDFDIFNCEKHKSDTIEYMLELSCIFFIFNWCRDINKIINGTRLDLDTEDKMKMLAYNYYNKRKHYKKSSSR